MTRTIILETKSDKGLMWRVDFKVTETGKPDALGTTHMFKEKFDTDAKILTELNRRFG